MSSSHRRALLTATAAGVALATSLWISASSVHAQQGGRPIPDLVLAYPDLIMTNGKIMTVDTNFSIVEALAIRDGKVLATGSNAMIESLAGPKTQRMNLGGKSVMPGIIDTHLHGQMQSVSQYLKDKPTLEPRYTEFQKPETVKGTSVAEVLENLGKIAATRKPGEWIGVDLGSPELGVVIWDKVRRKDLDKVVPNNPLVLGNLNVRGSLINTKVVMAMKDFYGAMPEDFPIDSEGLNNGQIDDQVVEYIVADLLIDHPMQSLYPAFRLDGLKWAAMGLTTDASRLIGLSFQPVYREMERRHEMPIRISYSAVATQSFPQAPQFFRHLGDVSDMGSEWIWMAGASVVTADLDPCATIPAATLRSNACYISNPNDLKRRTLFEAVKAGNRLTNTHVSGDLAVDNMLDIIEEASKAAGMTPDQIRAKGHTMDHCTLNPRPDQIVRGKQLGIIWSCAGNRVESAERWASEFGVEYANKWVAPVASILKAGSIVAGHGEGAGEGGYFTYMEELVTRKDKKGKVWGAQDAIDRKQLLHMYTMGSAAYVGRADRMGSLERGKLADLVVLDKDYMAIPDDQLHTLKPILTMVGGKIVFKDASAPAVQ